jgi:hypothetical protein
VVFQTCDDEAQCLALLVLRFQLQPKAPGSPRHVLLPGLCAHCNIQSQLLLPCSCLLVSTGTVLEHIDESTTLYEEDSGTVFLAKDVVESVQKMMLVKQRKEGKEDIVSFEWEVSVLIRCEGGSSSFLGEIATPHPGASPDLPALDDEMTVGNREKYIWNLLMLTQRVSYTPTILIPTAKLPINHYPSGQRSNPAVAASSG